MPRTAMAASPERQATPTPLDELLERGRAQGRLSLSELRAAFAKAGVSPAEGRSILHELAEAGVQLAEDAAAGGEAGPEHVADLTAAGRTGRAGAERKRAGRSGGRAASRTKATAGSRRRRKDAEEAAEAGAAEVAEPDLDDLAPEDLDLPEAEITDADLADGGTADLDDTSSVLGDSVHTYLKSIGRRTLLTAAQEVELAKRIEAGLYAEYKLKQALESGEKLPPGFREDLEWVIEDGKRAKDHMLEANLRLVVSVAKKYTDRGMSLLDVVQEGNLGLIRAVEKFDYTKGYKFSTYAMWWIRQAIQRGFADSARTIRLPVHVLEMLSKLSRVERDMHQRLGREPTPEELAVELDKTPDQIEELLRTSRQPISLDSTIGEDGETCIGDLIEDVDSLEASEIVDRQLLAEQLKGMLDNLSPREAKIMSLRFGLVDGKPHTLDEIGKRLGLTRERIRQLEKESLSKLRHPSNARPLMDWAC